jgi:hypothetical protein
MATLPSFRRDGDTQKALRKAATYFAFHISVSHVGALGQPIAAVGYSRDFAVGQLLRIYPNFSLVAALR